MMPPRARTTDYVALLVTWCFLLLWVALMGGCRAESEADPKATAPPPAPIERKGDGTLLRVEHPEQYPLATATRQDATPELSVTGVVNPDVSRAVPVISLASGRVVDLRARLGDSVEKGQLLLRIQSLDISGAFSDYRKAVADEGLARVQLERARKMYEAEVLAKKDFEVAEETAEKAQVDVETTLAHLRVLGVDPAQRPTGIVEIFAPVSGVITEQNVTNAAGVKTLDNSPNLFTISDLSYVWIVCDVYENDLKQVRLGDQATIRLNSYPDHVVTGQIQNIGAVLDPTLRTAKVRIEVANPGTMRIGMFVTATFRGQTRQSRAVVPATAVLHLHDREWVYVPVGEGQFRRVEVTTDQMLAEGRQALRAGLQPGQRVVANALALQATYESTVATTPGNSGSRTAMAGGAPQQ
jgi:cobalt-zinc-cadmium efflux system membrane fusion protein